MTNVFSECNVGAPYLPGAAVSPLEQKIRCAITSYQAACDITSLSFILRKSERTKQNHAQKQIEFHKSPFSESVRN
jgi:hypothetical protein